MADEIRTQVPGNIWKVLAKPGNEVAAGDTLFIMEVMKSEVPHVAEQAGRVISVHIKEGDESIDADVVAVVIELAAG